ncbi:hypothetical protein BXZ70DRAFT_665420 [Cristinia sonorae]|uniref:HIT-type domain-containing protein n=1 Tax=Cristinia sonorae TaxID=1940300 RepID=A0A8K0UTP2_9AGAR|nr:hypothetical protein BXZ70DRAFT_665420 [Cristinia sonorae]
MSGASSSELLIPSSSSSSVRTETVANIPCNICRRQFSRYTCPKCNIPYCSLTCFRSETHSECSESFYKKELETQIKTEPSKTMEDRRKMMELLKRFEEEAAEDAEVLEGEDEEEDDIAERLDALDLENATYDDIWAALTPAEQDKFMKALGDPSSEMAQQLLASEELEKHIIEPWWERDAVDRRVQTQDERAALRTRRFGETPPSMVVPQPVLNASSASSGSGPSLLHNITAVLVSYAYTTRHFSTSPLSELKDPDRQEARDTISQLVPFLTDKKSTTVLPSTPGMVTDVWSRFTPGTVTANSFAALLRDASKLIRPPLVTEEASDTDDDRNHHSSYPHHHISSALNDLASLFAPTSTRKPTHISHKLTFYAARVLVTPSPILHMLAAELAARADRIEREGVETEMGTAMGRHPRRQLDIQEPPRRVQGGGGTGKASIEELT